MVFEIAKKIYFHNESFMFNQKWFQGKFFENISLNFFLDNIKEWHVNKKNNYKNRLRSLQKFYKILELTFFILKSKESKKNFTTTKNAKYLRIKLGKKRKIKILTI
jgi:hypothetical protein